MYFHNYAGHAVFKSELFSEYLSLKRNRFFQTVKSDSEIIKKQNQSNTS